MNDKKHPSEEWQEELQDAPNLQRLKRESIFHPPDGYFDRLAEHIQESVEKTPSTTASTFLNQVPKKNIFSVPALYFEELPHRLMQLVDHIPIPAEESRPIKPLWRPQYVLAIAASVSLLLMVAIWLFPSTKNVLELKDIPVEDLMAEIDWQDIPAETLVEVLGEEKDLFDQLDESGQEEKILNDLLQEMDDNELEDLLLDI
ncbi:MAG: hypothetical protein AAF587_07335 [Bacteroidota bacterium]